MLALTTPDHLAKFAGFHLHFHSSLTSFHLLCASLISLILNFASLCETQNETSQLSPVQVRRGTALVAGFSFADFDQLYQL